MSGSRSASHSTQRCTLRVRNADEGVVYHLMFDGSLNKLTGAQLKRHLQGISLIPADEQRLTYQGRLIHDSTTGRDLGLADKALLILEPAGGSATQAPPNGAPAPRSPRDAPPRPPRNASSREYGTDDDVTITHPQDASNHSRRLLDAQESLVDPVPPALESRAPNYYDQSRPVDNGGGQPVKSPPMHPTPCPQSGGHRRGDVESVSDTMTTATESVTDGDCDAPYYDVNKEARRQRRTLERMSSMDKKRLDKLKAKRDNLRNAEIAVEEDGELGDDPYAAMPVTFQDLKEAKLAQKQYVWDMEQMRFETERLYRERDLQRMSEALDFETEILERERILLERKSKLEKRKLLDFQNAIREDMDVEAHIMGLAALEGRDRAPDIVAPMQPVHSFPSRDFLGGIQTYAPDGGY